MLPLTSKRHSVIFNSLGTIGRFFNKQVLDISSQFRILDTLNKNGMTEAVFGLVGVLLGSGISWFQSYWSNRRETKKNARYLAIRLVCIFDKYLDDCTAVVYDNGLSEGQRTADGCLTPQVKTLLPQLIRMILTGRA